MSFEYTIKFERDSDTRLDSLLRSIAGFDGIESQFGAYSYRSKANPGKMPDADVRIEESGVYVCVYGGAGPQVLRDLMALLLSEFDEVTAAKLDWE